MAAEHTRLRLNASLLSTPPLSQALDLLCRASDYATDLKVDQWQFAIGVDEFRQFGVASCELRWLIRHGLVEAGVATPAPPDCSPSFEQVNDLGSPSDTHCFVLSERGRTLLRSGDDAVSFHGRQDAQDGLRSSVDRRLELPGDAVAGSDPDKACPCWDAERRELRVGGRLVKSFRGSASNQTALLAVFEEEGWPTRIDDPLPITPTVEPKRRLHDAIKCLNRNHENHLVHFRGDGTGEGVLWEHVGIRDRNEIHRKASRNGD